MKGTAMKIEIEKDFPQYFKPAHPEEFELFSHFEVTREYRRFSLLLRLGKRTENRMCAFIRGAAFTETKLLSLL